jgi:two-component sensor histidine kinase
LPKRGLAAEGFTQAADGVQSKEYTMARSSTKMDLADHLRGVAGALLACSLRGPATLIDELGAECRQPAERVLVASMIVAELITISLKYAHPTEVDGIIVLGCRRDDHGHLIYVVTTVLGSRRTWIPTRRRGWAFASCALWPVRLAPGSASCAAEIGTRAELSIS